MPVPNGSYLTVKDTLVELPRVSTAVIVCGPGAGES